MIEELRVSLFAQGIEDAVSGVGEEVDEGVDLIYNEFKLKFCKISKREFSYEREYSNKEFCRHSTY